MHYNLVCLFRPFTSKHFSWLAIGNDNRCGWLARLLAFFLEVRAPSALNKWANRCLQYTIFLQKFSMDSHTHMQTPTFINVLDVFINLNIMQTSQLMMLLSSSSAAATGIGFIAAQWHTEMPTFWPWLIRLVNSKCTHLNRLTLTHFGRICVILNSYRMSVCKCL